MSNDINNKKKTILERLKQTNKTKKPVEYLHLRERSFSCENN